MVQKQHCLMLKHRHIIEITGEDATHFLHNLITTDVENLAEGDLLPGALLSPQGKVLFDFLIAKYENSYFIDISNRVSALFLQRLTLYKMRSKIEIIKHFELVTSLYWNFDKFPSTENLTFFDKRFKNKEKIARIYSKSTPCPDVLSSADTTEVEQAWDRLRINYGIAESDLDFTLGDVFPHDINYDQIGGLSFKKGCYIGQEVISRMHHRGTARRRMLIVEAKTDLPNSKNEEDATIFAAGKPIGTLGSCVGNIGLALMRIDRVKAAMDTDTPITLHDISLTVKIAENMAYDFPQDSKE